MKYYGCIGKKLTHSFSKEIHAELADYDYRLIELDEKELPAFLKQREFQAINVTIPYKEAVVPYLDEISDVAKRIGAVNTVVQRSGRLLGYNTDYYGMKALIQRVGADLRGKKVLILGTGGTSKTARVLAADLGGAPIVTVSRKKGEDCISYEEAMRLHGDAQILINTTPVGMYPNCEACPIDLSFFPKLEGVIDAVYNPLRTNLVLDARERGIPAEGGLYMLVMQAVVAVEHFLDTAIDEAVAQEVYRKILAAKENIVLIGMPGSGKSTVGKALHLEGFSHFDSDTEIEKECGCSIKELIQEKGEAYFRDAEQAVIGKLSAESARILSTGGGAVLRKENVRSLKRNGTLYFLHAPLTRLRATQDRPLSDTEEKLTRLYQERMPIYRACADVIVEDMASAEEEASYILKARREFML